MPSGRDWLDLVRSTFHSVGRKDLSGLYGREWQRARAKLTADHAEELGRPGNRIRRYFRTTNAVMFGLSRRLAPARRVLFAAALLCLLFSFQGPSFFRSTEKRGHLVRTTEYHFYFDNGWLFLALIVVVLLLAMELVDKINFRDELELARDLQASLIPRVMPTVPGWELGAHNEIANTVGGDIYDFVPLEDGRLAVLFGDASGHGMAAGLVMAVAHASFRTQLEMDPAPEAMFATLNRILCRTGGPRAFFSCVYLLLAPDGTFQGTVAGHPPVLKLSAAGGVLGRIGKGAYPLGIRTPLTWEVESGALETRERLLLYSDGVSEGRDAAGVEFGEERVIPIARTGAGLYPSDLVFALARELRVFRGDEAPEDDVSIAVLARL
ncbi:MAG: PP2C family protein-serine/threonine phosphatase [Acidobacteriota bacterium]